MKLQILVPQYKENDTVVKPLLDSLALQQNVDLRNEVGVVIVNDGSDVFLSDELIHGYPFSIDYIHAPHNGVSAARNAALAHATAEYVMFCDADDMFYNPCGLYILFREINNGGFDTLVSPFIEETRNPETHEPEYITHNMDSTFVHGKVHRREYLMQNNILWNDELTIHEDSYFNILCQSLTENAKFCPTPFYLWRWRDDSVCRHDPKYILKTYNNLLDSNTALIHQFLSRHRMDKAQFFATSIVYDAYFTMNKDEWINQENKQYRDATELRFKKYYDEFKMLFLSTPDEERNMIIVGLKNRMFGEGLMLETQTFDSWIEHIQSL